MNPGRSLIQLMLWFTLAFTASQSFAVEAERENVAAAVKEGKLYVYGSLDRTLAEVLVKEFEAGYPGIKVDFINMTAADVFSRNMNDLAGRRVSADILWNSDITLQAALVKGGYALPYRAATGQIMPLANVADTVFVNAFEPVVMAYNKKLVVAEELPVNRKQLLQLAGKAAWRGKIGTCDPEKSSLAFLLLTQDLAHGQNFWDMVARLGDAGLRLYPDYQALLEGLSGGEVMAGYNLPLSAVLKKAATDTNIGWLYTVDYTLVIPQSVLIAKAATHPHAARLWIDFLFSPKAQQIIAENCDLFPVDPAVAGGDMKRRGGKLPPQPVLKVIGTGAEVTRFAESGMKKSFLLRWKQKLHQGK
jgi:iron(III) transport system substrate-binding protein